MKTLIPVISSTLQMVYVLTLINAIVYVMWGGLQIQAQYETGDPRMLAGAISSVLVILLVATIVGLVGVFLAKPLLRDKEECPKWFLKFTAVIVWAWLIFIPVGTAIGLLLRRWYKMDKTRNQIA